MKKNLNLESGQLADIGVLNIFLAKPTYSSKGNVHSDRKD